MTINSKAAESDNIKMKVSFFRQGQWTEEESFFLFATQASIKSKTFKLPGSLPEKVMLRADDTTDDFGFWKVFITDSCDYVLREDPAGQVGTSSGSSGWENWWFGGDGGATNMTFESGECLGFVVVCCTCKVRSICLLKISDFTQYSEA